MAKESLNSLTLNFGESSTPNEQSLKNLKYRCKTDNEKYSALLKNDNTFDKVFRQKVVDKHVILNSISTFKRVL